MVIYQVKYEGRVIAEYVNPRYADVRARREGGQVWRHPGVPTFSAPVLVVDYWKGGAPW